MRAAHVDVLEMFGSDQDVVARHQMHHAQERGGGYVTGQAANFAGLEIDYHGVAEAFRHECYAKVVRRDVGAFAEMSKDFEIRRQIIERIPVFSLGWLGKKQCDNEAQQHTHADILTKSRSRRSKVEVSLARAPEDC